MGLNKLRHEIAGEIKYYLTRLLLKHSEIKESITFLIFKYENSFCFYYDGFQVDGEDLTIGTKGKKIVYTIRSILECKILQKYLKIYSVLVESENFKITINYSHIIITHYV